ncbi:MAG: hypothetical protein JNG89_10505, partial [Planctomycetaceae bacterium]|nr:hypothetical protein [Planctomycetaceae bacterium]
MPRRIRFSKAPESMTSCVAAVSISSQCGFPEFAPKRDVPVVPRRCWALLAASCWLSAISGCGESDGVKHHALQGSVVREGKPMAAGVIQFVPSNGGPAALTAIADGKYAFTEQNGPVEGEQVVTITRTLERESVPEGTPKKDADFIPETGFNSTMPAGGWQLTTTVS